MITPFMAFSFHINLITIILKEKLHPLKNQNVLTRGEKTEIVQLISFPVCWQNPRFNETSRKAGYVPPQKTSLLAFITFLSWFFIWFFDNFSLIRNLLNQTCDTFYEQTNFLTFVWLRFLKNNLAFRQSCSNF